MKVIVLSCAEEEFAEAVDYYNDQCPGLGYEFAAEVNRSFDRIVAFPEAWSVFSGITRRCLIDRFPFAVLYRIEAEYIRVGAIMHLKRNPTRWQNRAEYLLDE